jgi:16S rRNA (cytidine1402-2'-O)-methyltransferase
LKEGRLYLVATPIGNLADITYRAVKLLAEVDEVLAEDTRQTSKLLNHYSIEQKLTPFHQHNEHKVLSHVVEQLKNGKTYALCSDAGTPGISDPGFLLVRACVENNIPVESLPGATAVIPALTISGLPCDKFVFEGFLPHKKGKQTAIKKLLEEERTTVFYESPHRLLKTLTQMKEILGNERKAVVCRELTKKFEETVRGSLLEVYNYFENKPIKGEIVLIIAGNET